MLEYENTQKVVKTVEMDGRHLIGHDSFKEKLQSVNTMHQILQEVNKIENQQSAKSEMEREIERENQKAQVDAEYDASQQRNLLMMVLNLKEDLASKLKQHQIESANRWSEAFS